MRGADTFTESLFTMRKLEDFVPPQHPLRAQVRHEPLQVVDFLRNHSKVSTTRG